MKKCVLNLILCLLYAGTIHGQNSKLQNKPIEDILTFHLLDVESGLSHNVVNSIEQDALGFIWVATIEGLNCYDGTQFTKYKKKFKILKHHNKPLNNPINCFVIGPDKELIIGAYSNDSGIQLIDKNRKLKYY